MPGGRSQQVRKRDARQNGVWQEVRGRGSHENLSVMGRNLGVSPASTSSVGGWNASPSTSLEALGTLGSREVDESDDRNHWSEELLWPGQWEGGGRRDRGGSWGGEAGASFQRGGGFGGTLQVV